MLVKRFFTILLVMVILIPSLLPINRAEAAVASSYQTFSQNLSKELNTYISNAGGTITLHYKDFATGDEYKLNSTAAKRAASTIKLPLALYIMELAAEGKLNLNQKLTYKSYHYYGGSGVIQYQRVGTQYTIRDLVKKAMIHSDNIAFIMLREKVGRSNFIAYMKRIGGKYAYPGGKNLTSSADLVLYANRLYDFSQKNALGNDLVEYLKKTDYNTTIPHGVKGVSTAHKVGMIPLSRIYNDIGIVYDKNPFALAVMTNNLPYEKSQKVIADIASIVYKHHKIKNNVAYIKTKKTTAVYYKAKAGSKRMGTLIKGEAFKINADKGKWYEIQYAGKKGYIYKDYVIAYPSAPASGFKENVKNTGLAKTKGKSIIRSKPSTTGNVIGDIYQSTTIRIVEQKGNYYSIMAGDRVGYIHKDWLILQYTGKVTHFETTEDNARFYSLINGKYVLKGVVKKGEVFKRIKGVGGFNQVQIGSSKAYIRKRSTTPLFNADVSIASGNEPIAGEIVLTRNQYVFSEESRDKSKIIGKLIKDEKISYVKVNEEWYEINYLGRKAYLQNLMKY